MITTTRLHDGSLECSIIHNGRLVRYRYFGYTKRDAVAMFREYLKTA